MDNPDATREELDEAIAKLSAVAAKARTAAFKMQSIYQITNDKSQITNKIIRDNLLLILRGDKTYTPSGQEIIVP